MAATLVLIISGCSPATSSTTTGATPGQALPTVAVPSAARDLETTVQTVIRTVTPAVAEIQCSGGQGQSVGSGNIVRADGYIVTNDHVVRGHVSCQVVLANAQALPAQLVGEAPGDDLAVLKVTTTSALPPINLADSSQMQVGSFVLAIGSPLGLSQSATFGIVSALNRSASEAPDGPAGTLIGLIQTSAPINPGNSGGALVDLRGELVGIPTLGATDVSTGVPAQGIGFAIPSNRVKFIANQLVQSGRVIDTGQGFLGITGQDVTAQLASSYGLPVSQGVLVTGFTSDVKGRSPAQQAGLLQGDIITAIDSQAISGNGDLSAFLMSRPPGATEQVTIHRGTSQRSLAVTLGERPV